MWVLFSYGGIILPYVSKMMLINDQFRTDAPSLIPLSSGSPPILPNPTLPHLFPVPPPSSLYSPCLRARGGLRVKVRGTCRPTEKCHFPPPCPVRPSPYDPTRYRVRLMLLDINHLNPNPPPRSPLLSSPLLSSPLLSSRLVSVFPIFFNIPPPIGSFVLCLIAVYPSQYACFPHSKPQRPS